MLAKESYTNAPATTLSFIHNRKQNIQKRRTGKIKRRMKKLTGVLKGLRPSHWFDGFLDEIEIDLKELK